MLRLWIVLTVSHLMFFTVVESNDDYCCKGLSGEPPALPREGKFQIPYAGRVTKLDKDSITIKWVNSPGVEPKTFAFSEALAAGKVPLHPRQSPEGKDSYKVEPMYMYRRSDVKVGDCVGIGYACVNGVNICDHIRIFRRPDGLVPPLPKEADELDLALHKSFDIREKYKNMHPGRALPEWMDLLPHFRYVPYHVRTNAYWAKIAPMPREIKQIGLARDP